MEEGAVGPDDAVVVAVVAVAEALQTLGAGLLVCETEVVEVVTFAGPVGDPSHQEDRAVP
jgi:hypothetical protein